MLETKSLHLFSVMVVALAGIAPVLACGDETSGASPGTPLADAGDTDGAMLGDAASEAGTVAFGACPGAFSGACAKIPMPLDWNAPNGKTVGVLVDKISSTVSAKKQLWLLQGGPGGSAAAMIPIGLLFAQELGDVDVFTIEHRGVGPSNRLACDAAEKALAASTDAGAPDGGTDGGSITAAPDFATFATSCVAEVTAQVGADLPFYSTTNAARDLARAIELTRKDGQEVYVYGVSYGTAWAQRYMQIAPNQASGVILDSIVPPGAQFLSTFDTQGDLVGKKLAEICKVVPECSALLGADPWSFLVQAKQKLEQGHCAEAGFSARDRVLFTGLLRARPYMGIALAAWGRLDRCSAEDVAALQILKSRLPLADPNASLFSQALYFNVAFSELWETPAPPAATLEQRFEGAVFATGTVDVAPVYDAWPKYSHDEHWGKYPDVDIPVLVLNGTLDSQTPIELAIDAKQHYTRPGQTFIEIPNANHATVMSSPTNTATGPKDNCGFQIARSFVQDPRGSLETACLVDLAPVQFDGDPSVASYFFGTDSVFLPAQASLSRPTAPVRLLDVDVDRDVLRLRRFPTLGF